MQNHYTTNRLLLHELTLNDTEFISELVNTPEWIRFIGERNIKTKDDAIAYVQRLIDNPDIQYWVVQLKESQTPVGIITFIKRDYLEHPDIGFAFLPSHAKKGYAYEAAAVVLNNLIQSGTYSHILAATIRENSSSIKLLEKLGLRFSHEIQAEEEILLVYAIMADKLYIDQLVKTFFSIFNNTDNRQPDWNIIYTLCLPETLFVKKSIQGEVSYNLHTFIEPRKQILSDGTLTEFEEHETTEETKIIGNLAQRFSTYKKSGYLAGKHFREHGNKLFQFVKTNEGWKINSLIWEDRET